jgi:Tol biopolymer transport system component
MLGTWSPDGSRILYRANTNGVFALYAKQVSGTAPEELLLTLDQSINGVFDWSEDNQYALFSVNDPATGNDLWFLPLFGDRKPQALTKTQFAEGGGRFSRDGKWVAYVSNESGSNQVYAQSFPSGGHRVQVSVSGGGNPRWRRDGRELYFLEGRNLMAVEIKATSSTIEAGIPKTLFQLPGAFNANFDVTANGQRFIFAMPPVAIKNFDDDAPLTVILNWTAAVKH